MAYWLIKTEPSTWSWHDQKTKKVTHWDGVRNYQASNNMKAMKKGDLCFFYHSVSERQIMGIVQVIREYYPDHTDEMGRFGMVDVEYVEELSMPVSLDQIKALPELQHIALVRQSRLSVMPIDQDSWKIICQLGGKHAVFN
ncbi:EVE domain-containing protein [Candidatus Odyssella thessalonicensis]|uniref:EVE domain-containing protein n=1 Tax=Candidatus Odyssella thessalonicensis TaxID=84647 RepID=UPI000225A8F3|nr:EVE domain-containing protein [Candidatus Odyssella thessalonicensis]